MNFTQIKFTRDKVILGVAVLAILITGGLVLAKNTDVFSSIGMLGVSEKAIAEKTVEYINKNLLQAGQTATLVSTERESGLIKIKINIGGKEYNSYITRDGKFMFANDPYQLASGSAATAGTTTKADIQKVDNTQLEAYVVSACPFGLQMQRAMAEAIKGAPELANSVKVRYIGSISGNAITAMHDAQPGGAEAQENLKQICLREEQPEKYWPYVSCYMQKATGALPNSMPTGDSAGCSTTAGIDVAKVNACMSDPARGLAYAKEDFDLNTKYNVQGSPTLILNGQRISEDDFGGRSADAIRAIVCDSSTTQGAFCSTPLNTAPAATSFSVTYASTTGSAASPAANCAPAS